MAGNFGDDLEPLVRIREEVVRGLREDGRADGFFKICKLALGRIDLESPRLPSDMIGLCQECKREVVFDAQISLGKILICYPCAIKARNSLKTELEATDPMEMGEDDIATPDLARHIARNRDQYKSGETRMPAPPRPAAKAVIGHNTGRMRRRITT